MSPRTPFVGLWIGMRIRIRSDPLIFGLPDPTYNKNIFFFFILISGRIQNIFPAEPDPDPSKKISDPHSCFLVLNLLLQKKCNISK